MRELRRLVTTVRRAGFDAFLAGARFSVLVVEARLPVRVREPLPALLKNRWSDQVQIGAFDRREVPDARLEPAWWPSRFRTAVGRPLPGPLDGVYLFEAGTVIGYHPPPDVLASDDQAARLLFRYLDERIALAQIDVPPFDDPVPGEPPPPGRPAPPPLSLDPFRVLEVDPQADEATVRAAWVQQLKLYHPDRVAHLGKRLQEVALAETLRIQAAFDAIRRRRGW